MKKLIFILAAFLLIGTVYAVSMSSTLNFTNVEGSDAAGKAKIMSKMKKSLNDVEIRLQLIDIPIETGYVYEAWLVDVDTSSRLSLGAFTSSNANRANYKFKQQMVNFELYDKIIVTREPLNDQNPAPGTIILEADIHQNNGIPATLLVAHLDSEQETSESNSEGTGFGAFMLNTEANTLSYNITFDNLEDEETVSHIHGPASRGESAPPIHDLPDGNPKVGVWNYEESQEQNILDGKTYVNIHTEDFPNGEIRGQIELA